MTELLVQLNGVWKSLDITEKPALNIQYFDLSDLSERYVPYSQSFKIPATANNKKILDNSNEFTRFSDISTKYLPCKYNDSGVKLCDGFLNIISTSETDFNINIVGSNDFFYKVKQNDHITGKQKTLNDLSIDDTILRSNSSFKSISEAKASNAFYCAADFDKTEENKESFSDLDNYIKADNQKPFVWFDYIMRKILSDNGGYTLDTQVNTSNLALPLASINQTFDIEAKLDKANGNKYTTQTFSQSSGDEYMLCKVDEVALNGYVGLSSEKGIFETNNDDLGIKYIAPYSGKYFFNVQYESDYFVRGKKTVNGKRIDFNYNPNTIDDYVDKDDQETISYDTFNCNTNFVVMVNGKIVQSFPSVTEWGKDYIGVYKKVVRVNTEDNPIILDLNQNDIVTFHHIYNIKRAYINVPAILGWTREYIYGFVIEKNIALSVDYIKPRLDIVRMGVEIPVKGNLPNMTQYDFFTTYLKMYNLIPYVDNYTKIIKLRSFSEVIANKNKAIPWKAIKNTGSYFNTIGNYAKSSIIKYSDVTRDSGNEGRITITEELAELLFSKGIVIYYYETDETVNPGYISLIAGDEWIGDMYKYQTLPDVVNQDDLTIKDEAFIRVINEILPTEKVIVTLLFDANELYYATDKNGKKFEYCKYRDCEDNVLNKYTKPRLSLITGDIVMDITSSTESTVSDKLVCVASSNGIDENGILQSIDMSTLINNYRAVEKNVFNDVRFISDITIDLKPKDIELFNPFIPIYIEKFGAYFYVNKIKNFVSNKLTKCDLVKI